MMTYKIEFEKAARKFIKKQEVKQQKRLFKAIYQLPNGTDIKPLTGTNLYRLRVGDFRVIYSKDDKVCIINIENIDNRGDVYK